MMNKGCLLLCATALSLACLDNQAQASINFNLKAPPILSVADKHTQHTPNFSARSLSSPLLIENVASGQEIKVAQVCWIMDLENCGGADFVDVDGNIGDESCIKMGYTLTSCPDDYKPYKRCPTNNSYFADCTPNCPSNYQTCAAPLQGVGTACAGNLYKDCCTPTCGDEYKYDADNIPVGYEAVGEPCTECDGSKTKIKYKEIKEKDCTGYIDCGGKCATGSETCQSGDKLMCKECKPCPNLGTKSSCPPCTVCSYEKCSNLYIVSGCKTGCTDWCAINCAAMGYKQQTCADKYVKCPSDISYVYCLGN